MNALRSSVLRLSALSRCLGLQSSLLVSSHTAGLVVPLQQVRCYATGKAAPKARMEAKRAPNRRAAREVEEQEEEEEDDAPEEVISSEDVIGEVPQWNWIGEFPREDFSEKTDKVIAGTDYESIPVEPKAFAEYSVPEDFKYIRDCPVHYTHREYIGTGLLRGKRVPGTNKVTLRMNIADLKLTDAQQKYFAALAGKRFHPGKGELKMTCGLYTIPEDNIRYLYDLTSRLVDESVKADAIDAAVAAGRAVDADPAVQALEADAQQRAAARADLHRRERERREQAEKQRILDERQARAEAVKERIRRQQEERALAKDKADAATEAPAAA